MEDLENEVEIIKRSIETERRSTLEEEGSD